MSSVLLTSCAVAMDGRAGRSIWIDHTEPKLWGRVVCHGIVANRAAVPVPLSIVLLQRHYSGTNDLVACNCIRALGGLYSDIAVGSR
jgi:hypothetical protein